MFKIPVCYDFTLRDMRDNINYTSPLISDVRTSKLTKQNKQTNKKTKQKQKQKQQTTNKQTNTPTKTKNKNRKDLPILFKLGCFCRSPREVRLVLESSF